jgi:hypothetical protein
MKRKSYPSATWNSVKVRETQDPGRTRTKVLLYATQGGTRGRKALVVVVGIRIVGNKPHNHE